ncbi:9-hexadecenoic acid cis-trans isomerase [Corallincola luteus]|uniref:9-hexadecenoic acid cis-trans isomerase n=1 Tax=Corallincola luteus TaxID=1775177 RepID=A0ABY2AHF4_9GAMM|nr:fatty acid cis/trans isomerase [Corallincola luteus]TCI01982.1 9-hexadecenoic acid cis-trans isomerase [Corallincola luteus]
MNKGLTKTFSSEYVHHVWRKNRRYWLITLVSLFSGCAVYTGLHYDQLYGFAEPQPRLVSKQDPAAQHYLDTVRPIIEKRCVACHACYDAPCQLKLSSAEGIDRGASKDQVYDGTRLLADKLTRMFVDAQTTAEWRDKAFYPVLNERAQTKEANLEAGVMARMLQLKQAHPLPTTPQLDADKWDFALDRNQQCPDIEQMASYEKDHALWGMPYGLPAIPKPEHDILIDWLAKGAIMATMPEPNATDAKKIEHWEVFLNGDELKQQLTSRYLYEHLFLSSLYFDEPDTTPRYYRIVRSATPPGQAIEPIATRRPFDDPKVKRVYYRLMPDRETIVDKTHMPYRLDAQRLENWQTWFIDSDYQVSALPGYHPDVASNPMRAFHDLPIDSRYRFLLDEAQNTIMNFIKGPVCRGQLALNVINDRFWVFFVDPDLMKSARLSQFINEQAVNLDLPAEKDTVVLPLSNWLNYSHAERRFLKAKSEFMNKVFQDGEHLTPNLIWDGDGVNQNASLTIIRHFDSASVMQGLVGKPPKTAWIIDYTLLERIHYLLTAGFDVYGNFGHQLLTRMYMDFLRMEGESNFLTLLPEESRSKALQSWYQGASKELNDYLDTGVGQFHQPTAIRYRTEDPKAELYDLLKQRLAKVLPDNYEVDSSQLTETSKALLKKLEVNISGDRATLFPELTFIMIEQTDPTAAPQLFTLMRNSAHKNVSSLFDETDNRDTAKDNMTLIHGLVGSYPSAFWHLQESDLPRLVDTISAVESESGYRQLLDQYGIRRTAQDFWSFSDRLNQQYMQMRPIEGGLLDYNRIENR